MYLFARLVSKRLRHNNISGFAQNVLSRLGLNRGSLSGIGWGEQYQYQLPGRVDT